jgi:outer membrane lipoprotein SlyB
VTGAVLGGVAGHQMGNGKGKDAMTVVGVIGGAFAGNAAEKALRKTQHYEVTVRMEDGNTQTFNYQAVPPYSSGDAVRVDGGQLMRR